MREVEPPGGKYTGRNKVYSSVWRDWNKLAQRAPGPMRRCYIEIADNPCPPFATPRHHRLQGNLKEFWEYEVTKGARVRYKRRSDGKIVVTLVTSAPSDTH
jgi:mRNA-degrading endonuclease YafQ of YafQ-DinJ toxin-antitoxin module